MDSLKNHPIQVKGLFFGVPIVIIYFLYLMQWDSNTLFGGWDAYLNNFILEHGYAWLSGRIDSFWNGLYFYPEKNVLAFSENHLGTLPIYALLRYAGLSIEGAFQTWIFIIFNLNFLFCYIILNRLSASWKGSLCGAMVFTYCMPMMHQLDHIQLAPRYVIPFIFYFSYLFVTRNKIHYLGLMGLAFVYQMYCNIYIGLFSVIVLSICFLIMLIANRHRFFEYSFRPLKDYYILSVYIIICGLAALWLFYPYLTVSLKYGTRDWPSVLQMVPHVSSWFYMTDSFFYGWLGEMGESLPMNHEHRIFTGFMPLLALFFSAYILCKNTGFYTKHKIILLPCFAAAVLTLLIYTQIEGVSLYYLIFKIPGFNAIRAVSRVVLVWLFPVVVLLAFVIKYFENSNIRVVKTIIPFTLLIFCLAEQFFPSSRVINYKKNLAQNMRREVTKLVPEDADAFYYFSEWPSRKYAKKQIAAMHASLAKKIPTFNGYSGLFPHGFDAILRLDESEIDNYLAGFNMMYLKENPDAKIYAISKTDKKVIDIDKLMQIKFTISKSALKDYSYKINFQKKAYEINSNMITIPVTLVNTSNNKWSAGYAGKYGLALSYRTIKDGKAGDYRRRIKLPQDVSPGMSVTIPVTIPDIKTGKQQIKFSMVQDYVCWFHDKGQQTYSIQIIKSPDFH